MARIQIFFVITYVYMWHIQCNSLVLDEYSASSNLTKIVIDDNSRMLYVGGENYLIRLDDKLKEQQTKSVGPEFDSDKCFGKPVACSEIRSRVPDIINVLAINKIQSYLLACGTLKQGLCSIYSLSDFNTVYAFNATDHASFLGSKISSVAFFGRPPKGYDMDRRMLYAAVSTYDRTEEKFSPMTISTREIVYNGSQSSMRYLEDNSDLDNYSFLSVLPSVQSKFHTRYIYGFELKGYGYYVSIQPVDPHPTKTAYVTRLIQFCLDDKYYRTYIETVIQCSHNSLDYTLATSAYIKRGGTSDYLAVSFGHPSNMASNEPDPAYGTVVCNFSMTDARDHFSELQNYCYNGGTGTYPWWVYGTVQQCMISPGLFKDDTYCAYDVTQRKMGLTGGRDSESVFPTEADICIDEMITSVVLTDQLNHPIAVLGTSDGQLIKSLIGNKTSASLKAGYCDGNKPYMKYKLSEEPILQDMVMDATEEYVYVMSGKKITRFPLQSCAVYDKCSTCVSSKDPQGCGWCGDHCSKKDECGDPNVIFSHNTCKPIISLITPLSGPTDGGTMLTIRGDNFGYKVPEVTIGDSIKKCLPLTESLSNTEIKCSTHKSAAEGSFPVEVKVSDLTGERLNYRVDGTAKTVDMKFEYRTPTLSSVFPLYGPRSGGTIITLQGDNFHVGLERSVDIGTLPCDIKSSNKTVILCESPKGPQLLGSIGRRKRAIKKDFVKLTIDGATLYSLEPYEYKNDATVTQIVPASTIHSGGTRVTITGTNLDTVQQPKIGVTLSTSGASTEEDCVVNKADKGKQMICTMPNILPLMTSLDQTTLTHVSVYFVMDGIEKLLKLNKYNPSLSRYIYNPNPTVNKFEGEEFLRIFDIAEEYLEIKGEGLTRGLSKDDYLIYIGRNYCNVSVLANRFLHCLPDKPKSVGPNEPKQAVELQVGKYLRYDVGFLKFKMEEVVSEGGLDIGIVVLIAILAVIIVLIIVLIIIMKKRRMGPFKDPKEERFRYIHGQESLDTEGQRLMDQNRQNAYAEQGGGGPSSPYSTGIDEETRLLLQDQNLLIDRQFLQMGELLGAGHFGSVFKAYLTFPDVKGDEEVAVKTLHQNNPREIDVQAFLKEALIMKDFKHKNVLNLIGICLGMDDMPLVVLPYMRHGDLLTYIRNEENAPTIKDLITFGIDIAEGMAYLSELKFVHRDLACRNCMLDNDFRVKVADFGLSRDIYEKDYYASESKKTMLPVKWMALECLEKGKYSSKSDVWSFGIVLWELMTRGVNPYPEVDNWDIVRYLKHGRRMPQPQYCPDQLYAIMRKCWHPNPKERPEFSHLAHEINDMITMLEQAMKQGQHTADIQTTYVNMENCTDYHYTDELMPKGSVSYDTDSAPTSPTSPTSPSPQGASGTSKDLPSNSNFNHDTGSPQPAPKPKPEKKPSPRKEESTEKNETTERDENTEKDTADTPEDPVLPDKEQKGESVA
ncbi:hepatocyte growth factor receptor-like isoform X2 [Mercenaria mercenaria]|uniref:hepatocyte growth factor receptor-like isoform X2 n=1 Tax=Mercenaria mercenaria TaxID=6596 RepID=UPI00234F18A3|nr:hepatocyte growth factor receptor-like isoform X2 [Mercenaria mercenaria]